MALQSGSPCIDLDAQGIRCKDAFPDAHTHAALDALPFFPHLKEIEVWQPTELSHFCISSRDCL